jgi:hypothetical protein
MMVASIGSGTSSFPAGDFIPPFSSYGGILARPSGRAFLRVSRLVSVRVFRAMSALSGDFDSGWMT